MMTATVASAITANDTCEDTDEVNSGFMDLSGSSLVLDEDRGSGRAELVTLPMLAQLRLG